MAESFQEDDPFDPPTKRQKIKRTGQACDRCRGRKIKCDGALPSCTPCLVANVTCTATDRITKKAVPRGYVETLERKLAYVQDLKDRIGLLEGMLRERDPNIQLPPPVSELSIGEEGGSEKTPNKRGADETSSSPRPDAWREKSSTATGAGAARGGDDMPYYPNGILAESDIYAADNMAFREGGPHPGRSSGFLILNSLREAASTTLGVDVDVSDLNLNVGTEAASVWGRLRNGPSLYVGKPELPPRDIAYQFVDAYFENVHTFMPILHAKTFYDELDKMYSTPDYVPTVPFMFQYNMVFAIIATNLDGDQVFAGRAIPYFDQLFHEPALEHLQALMLMLVYLRQKTKAGGLWYLSRLSAGMAVELGLHRLDSVGNYYLPLDKEIRKRVFYAVLSIDRLIANSLGRPMALKEPDYNVNPPTCEDDEYFTSTNLSYPRQPPHTISRLAPAKEIHKIVVIGGRVAERLYSVQRPSRQTYVSLVEGLEKEMKEAKAGIPPYLVYNERESPETQALFHQAASIIVAYHELQILIRHPSLALSPSPQFSAASLALCAESSRTIIRIRDHQRLHGMVDSSWHTISIHMLAAFTILYSLWEKQGHLKPETIDQTKREMDMVKNLLSEIGKRLKAANKMREVITVLTKATVQYVEKSDKGGVGQKSGHGQGPPLPFGSGASSAGLRTGPGGSEIMMDFSFTPATRANSSESTDGQTGSSSVGRLSTAKTPAWNQELRQANQRLLQASSYPPNMASSSPFGTTQSIEASLDQYRRKLPETPDLTPPTHNPNHPDPVPAQPAAPSFTGGGMGGGMLPFSWTKWDEYMSSVGGSLHGYQDEIPEMLTSTLYRGTVGVDQGEGGTPSMEEMRSMMGWSAAPQDGDVQHQQQQQQPQQRPQSFDSVGQWSGF
ncbi:hypothetical protein SAICODRAFT_27728 [Saitoella complicata NRRL Y-17804]|uniref:Zn(2)-C6 fungal-type domain-containing protein n=1 Tax=Saitoella complicata (strain BCRC 22490 / CBS 7301 / JCM 7358 / NBRC 10748 / NRRL Y-17804) TaxID=698492 RepID=A0A0E9NL73_SAICN|nr:uncharacterized protein SAICODRAFT_27728 [Saitoella complicata NRRL Y-17804]ODQ50279.1 hypothetical protein SAICODRAFT_27728 [Saitoella complicata NRRL Y-17804]GAO50165.1 hypothetical protein G7K_4299-t1 [Saitoella complicata NRRL Y-17804]